MMSETAIQTSVCGTCGADVRDGSLFCYSCGKAVQNDSSADDSKPANGEMLHVDNSETALLPGSRPPLTSAASLRKQRRAFNRQPVEVTWEPRTGSPIAFLITTIVLVAAVLVFLLLALYLH